MPRVDAFEVPGLEIRFYSDDHMPPHLHVTRSGEWQIRVYILETTSRRLAHDVVFAGGRISRGARRELARLVALHREALLQEWEVKVQRHRPS